MCYNHEAKTFIYIKAGEYMSEVIEKFLRYVSVHTTSDDESQTSPSTARQFDLARMLQKEMLEMGIEDAYLDEKYCYVYGYIPANDPENTKTLGFISHMDTAPDASGKDVKPRTIENYDGSEIILNKEKDIKMSPVDFPELLDYKGKSLIVTDGTTLLGSDDKSGIAEIMTMASEIINHPERKHGRIAIAFTPDEEIGVGTAHFDLERFGADYAYTVDGGALGEIEFENFNAAAAVIKVAGRNVHPGEAKNKMVNAASIAMEFEHMLPQNEKPEYTEGYEGFIHLISMEGNTSEAKLQYIVRDHDRAKFEAKKELLKSIASF
jgi:tripeptide aminopeptidase